jgi:D-psicose/D-tagatose/L-ribulose 3-epimerase
MRAGINLLLWTTRVEEKHVPILERLQEAGYDGAEIPIHTADRRHYEKLAQTMDSLGLQRTVSTALPGAGTNLIGAQASSRRAAVDYLKSIIECVHALGAKRLVGPVYQALGEFPGRPPSEQEYEWATEGLEQVAAHAAEAGVTVCLEPLNRFECHLMNTLETGSRLVDRIGSPNIKLMYDSFHANIEEDDPLTSIDRYIDYIGHVHISENHRGTPGEGHLPLRETIDQFLAHRYGGWFVIEAFGTALPELAAATRCWRRTFSSENHVLEAGIRLLKS